MVCKLGRVRPESSKLIRNQTRPNRVLTELCGWESFAVKIDRIGEIGPESANFLSKSNQLSQFGGDSLRDEPILLFVHGWLKELGIGEEDR